MWYQEDERIVLTLDAGGTNFVFSAVQGNQEIVEPESRPAFGHDLEKSLSAIMDGFTQIREKLEREPVALSFSFPGPADYPNGIIGDLVNLPTYRGGIALGPMLRDHFKLPVFVNNDGDLFAYGEAIAGVLPRVNDLLEQANSPKRYKNLFGITLGTGFGGGIVRDNELFLGDNAAAAEIWPFPNKTAPHLSAEEAVSSRGLQHAYSRVANIDLDQVPSPRVIYEIALGNQPGNAQAARQAYAEFGVHIGHALAYACTLIDGLIVIGGGMAAAHPLFLQEVVKEMNGTLDMRHGDPIKRMESRAFNLEDEQERKEFLKGELIEITVPRSNRTVPYDPLKRVGVAVSKLGASKAMAIGAYAFALHELDR